jgi:hypothetical protein
MLEGEAQRAYLGIAEARTGSHHQPVRYALASGSLTLKNTALHGSSWHACALGT